jgi:alpha-L-rhamnosidase
MYRKFKYSHLPSFLSLLLIVVACQIASAGVKIRNLQVEYTKTPLGIDVQVPRFTWQMSASDAERGYSQAAYHLVVTNTEGQMIWDSKKVADKKSLNIQYAGSPLQATTRYNWTVTVWDQNGKTAVESSWFETGLLNPDPKLSAWDGASWIGGGDDDLVLYSSYLSVFKFSYKIKLDKASNSSHAGFIFGANDSRLMDRNKNIFWVENKKNESYIKFELDISPVDGSEKGLAQFNIYRVGYHPDDRSDKPFKTYSIPQTLINSENKYESHTVYAQAIMGLFEIFIDGTEKKNLITVNEAQNPSPFSSAKLNLNPVGNGHDFISFPMLAEIGFSLDAGQNASFSGLEIRNFRSPSNILFSEDLTKPETYKGVFSDFVKRSGSGLKISDQAYLIEGGKNGSLIITDPSKNSMPMLRTEFNSGDQKIAKARLYVTARGIYEMYINGERIGNDYFNPGLTQYDKTHLYQTYDVTDRIKTGKNAMGALLGEGWWSGNITYSGENWNYFGDRQSLLAKLVLTYTDGTTKIVTTNPETWTVYSNGPIVYGSFFQGEVYDASKEAAISGWNTSGYNDSKWKKAANVSLERGSFIEQNPNGTNGMAPVSNSDKMMLLGQFGENASIVKELTAVGVEEVRPGVFVYDMGQNMVGVPQITIDNGVPGNKMTLRFAEVKYPDLTEYGKNIGMIMLENIRAALTQDIYTLKGRHEVIQPRFTFHGYRFIEITGIEKALPLESVKGKVISSVKELASSYETSNSKVNKLWENITWSTRGNFLSIPTDCPQRNERMGWNGDISVFSRTSTYITNAPQFLRRHMLAMTNDQRDDGRFSDVAPLGGGFGGILWGSAGITVAWESFQQYGDKDMIAEHYDAMKKYLAFLETRIDPKTGIMNEGPLGDWLSPEGNKNDNTILWESYYIFDLEIMAKMADVLGNPEDAIGFRKKHDERKAFFNKTYVDGATGKTFKSGFVAPHFGPPGASSSDGKSPSGQVLDTQVSYAVPLALGAFSPENELLAARNLSAAVQRKNTDDQGKSLPEYSLMTGFIGTAWISKALSDHGNNDVAYRLLQQTSYPSWLYSVDQGATTIWERLNSYTAENGFGGNNSMNSFSHYSFGAVGAWMYNYSLGIQRDENQPGFKHFVLQPTPDPTGQMTFAKGHYDSMYGQITSGWKLDKGILIYSAIVPANTSATLYLPAISGEEITEHGISASKAKGIRLIKYENGKAVFELQSGNYEFKTSILKQ